MKEREQIFNLITGNIVEDQEKAEILNKAKNNPELKKEYNAIKNAWALSSKQKEVPDINIERSYLSVKSKIFGQNNTITRRLYSVLKYAAILLLFFWAGAYSDNILNFFSGNKLTDNQTEIIVPSGQVAEVNLPDGSHVWLNAGTSFSFSKDFSRRNRQVNLAGEAFFDVRKGIGEFVVSTKAGNVTVLGTSFNVSAFNDSEFQTTLVEGVVKYKSHSSNEEIMLLPDQQLIFSNDKGIQIREVETKKYTSWKNGIIIFDKEPLCSVIKKLERRFAIKIKIEDSKLRDIRFTGIIENETLPEVLTYLTTTKLIQYTYDKSQKTVIIKPM